MTAAPYLKIPAEPKPQVAPHPRWPLACVVMIVAVSTGCLLSLHLLGAANVLLGRPAITPGPILLTSALGILLAAFFLLRSRAWRRLDLIPITMLRPPRFARLIVAVTAIPFAILVVTELISLPNGSDPLAYHIDAPLKWLQNGSLRVFPQLGWQYALPGNGELPALIALSARMESAVAVGNLFAVALLAASAYLIAWKMTRETLPSLSASLVVITMPMVMYQSVEVFVDMFGTAFLLAAVALLLWRDRSPGFCTFLAGCAAGVAIGTKPTFWVYTAVFAVAAVTVILAGRSRMKFLLLLAAGMSLPSSFWFVRAAAATGNPVYPMQVSIGRYEIFRGYPRKAYHSDGFQSLRDELVEPWSDPPLVPNSRGSLPSSVSGIGPLFAAVALPGVLFLLWRVLRRRAEHTDTALLLSTAVVFLLWSSVLLRVLRFGLPVLALCCILAAPMLQCLFSQWRRLCMALLLTGVMLNSLFCVMEPVQRLIHRVERHDWSRATYYGYPSVLDRLPPGTRILDRTGWGKSFMLAGAGLTNYVLPEGDVGNADYVAKIGPDDSDDAALRALGATLIYSGVPTSLYPTVTPAWRIYRVH
jgi:hypothetical protein